MISRNLNTDQPSKYKLTKVGWIPEEWPMEPLNSVTPSDKKYGIVDGPFGSNLKTIHYRNTGVPIITSGYVTDGVFNAHNYLYVEVELYNKEKRSSVSGGDIIMAKIGARCGASAIMPRDHETGILSGNALKISVDEKQHSTYYVWSWLWKLHQSGKMELLKTVGAQPAISISNLKKYEIPLPPVKEQQKIAEILYTWDKAIQKQEALIAKKKELKKGLMQQLLTGKVRFPEFVKSTKTKQTKLGEIPEDWEVDFLSELCSKITDGSHASPKTKIGGLPIATVENINEGFINIDSCRTISEEDFNVLIKNGCKPEVGDVLLSKDGTIGITFPVRKSVKVVLLSSIAIIRPILTKLDSSFLSQTLKSGFFYHHLHRVQAGSALGRIVLRDIKKLPIPVPTFNEQQRIASVFSQADQEINHLETQLERLILQKKGLMQQLLTGKTRVKVEN